MSKNNIVKSGNIVKSDEARIIDSNARVADRLSYLAEIMDSYKEDYNYDDDFSTDGFTEGLDALQVERLFGEEQDGEMQEIVETPAVDTAQIEAMLAEANSEAERIISEANAQAEDIIASAQQEAQNIMQNAEREGHESGYNAGYEEGLRVADEAEQRCAARERELEEYYSNRVDELEPQFVEKLTDIYEQIFRVDLSSKKDLILYLISDAMRGIEGGKNFLVHVSPDDYPYVIENKAELSQGIPTTSTVEVIEDMTLSASQCFIEAESGIFDCGLGTELELLKKELMLLAFKKE